jgi:hypothetical protein
MYPVAPLPAAGHPVWFQNEYLAIEDSKVPEPAVKHSKLRVMQNPGFPSDLAYW